MTNEPIELERIGFDAQFQQQLAVLGGPMQAARVAIAHGESYLVWTANGPRKAVLVGRRIAEWRTATDRPQVGDWVAGTYSDSSAALLIEHVLPRRTCLLRKAAGTRVAAQVMAANVDVIGVVSSLAADGADYRLINARRLQRYLTTIADSGAQPLLIVNKIDLNARAVDVGAELSALFPQVALVLTSGSQRLGLDALQRWLQPGRTLGLVGMSGVGKSTLVNALLNRDEQSTQEVRAGDSRGRHTTSHRELFVMQNGALLMDMPGTRELGVWGDEPDAPPKRYRQAIGRTKKRG